MIDIELPKPIIKTKSYHRDLEQQAITAGLHPVMARVVASRAIATDVPLEQALFPKLKNLFSPLKMADMEKAAERVAAAIINGECIGLETDHDCDGQTSHAVLYHNLVFHFKHPKEKIRSYIGNRLTEGYGLSESVALRILADNPKTQLVITADNGSSDEPRIKLLRDAGIDVIVTDHHEIPREGLPISAYACLNPTRSDCDYGDPCIAGCMVAWLLMTATRQKLMASGYLPTTTPTLLDSLDFVAVGTIADCVSMARSINNRAVVAYGIKIIEAGTRPCWRAIKSTLTGPLTSEDLGFKIGPLLNSDGRLATAFGSVSFLLSDTDEEAMAWLFSLQESNQERKAIQQDIVLRGLKEAKNQMDAGRSSLCIYLEASHSGVHGIAASRLKDIFGRPTVFLTPKTSDLDLNVMTGSVRGIENFHVREALQQIANWHPNVLIAFGGHKGAGGLTLKLEDFDLFSDAFEKATRLQLQDIKLEPVIWTEGVLPIRHFNLELVDILSKLEPFGREFESPIFECEATLKELRFIGDGTHARVLLESEGVKLKGVWFKLRQTSESSIPVKLGDYVKVAFSLKANIFRNERSLDIHVVYLSTI
jgi:single-stranded-DNA-specific exonuclease